MKERELLDRLDLAGLRELLAATQYKYDNLSMGTNVSPACLSELLRLVRKMERIRERKALLIGSFSGERTELRNEANEQRIYQIKAELFRQLLQLPDHDWLLEAHGFTTRHWKEICGCT